MSRQPRTDAAARRADVRLWLLTWLLLPFIAATAHAQSVTTWQRPAVPGNPDRLDPEEILYAAPTTPDRIGRIMAPVFVNGRGPYRFVIDSGASRSAIEPRLATELGLVPDPDQALVLRGMTGTETVPSLLIEQLRAGDIVLRNQRLPMVSVKVFAGADGILGVDGFAGMCLHADFAGNRVSIAKAGCPHMRRGWMRVPASLRFGQLIRIGASIGSVSAHAIIDTGAEHSLGNLALLRALSAKRPTRQPGIETQVIGATSHEASGTLLAIPTLFLGRVGIRNMRITFGDFDVFRLWDLNDEPAMVIGMDMLGSVDALMIDYARVELRILPVGALDRVVQTGTRIR